MIHKVITKPTLPFSMDYAAQTEHIEKLTEMINKKKNAPKANYVEPEMVECWERDIYYDPTDMFALFPRYGGYVSADHPTAKFTGRCFDFDIEYVPTGEHTFDINVFTSNPKDLLCKDYIFFGNSNIHHLDFYFFHGMHKFSFDITDDLNAQKDFAYNGMKIFQFCSGLKDEALSLFRFMKAFLGGLTYHPLYPGPFGSHMPEYAIQANLKFLKDAMGIIMEERPISKPAISPDFIQSGDYFLV